MKEIFRMWKYTNMIVLTVLCAAIYVIFLVPFKSIPLIPGITEIRPANLFPILFGLLFGPAGAWGSAIGNLVGDLFGTLSIGSVFGFIGNFIYAFIPYKLWGKLVFFRTNDKTPTVDSAKKLMQFCVITILSSSACAIVISWGLDTLNLVPFAALSTIITLNNTVMTLVLGPALLSVLYRKAKKFGMLWTDILSPEDMTQSEYPVFYSRLVLIGSVGGLLAGLAISLLMADQTVFYEGLTSGGTGNIFVSLGILPFLVIMFFGIFKL